MQEAVSQEHPESIHDVLLNSSVLITIEVFCEDVISEQRLKMRKQAMWLGEDLKKEREKKPKETN